MTSQLSAPPDASGSSLPAYQRLKSKVQVTNSNMSKLIDGPLNSMTNGSVYVGMAAAAAANASIPNIPSSSAQSGMPPSSSGDRSPRRHGSVSGAAPGVQQEGIAGLTGSKLTSNSVHSTPRISVRNDSNILVGSVQPHPPQSDNARIRNNSGDGPAVSAAPQRKSMRIDRSRDSDGDSFSDGVASMQQQSSVIVPGVPMMNKQTRDSLKERLVI